MAKNASTKKEKSPEKNTKNSVKSTKWTSGIFRFLLKLFVVAIVSLGIYTIYLDSKVRHVFEGQRWQMPVQIYGEIAELEVGGALYLRHLTASLAEAGYQQVNYINEEGEFLVLANKITIQRRAFSSEAMNITSAQIEIEISQNKITNILVNKQPTSVVKLDPFLLDKIMPENKEDRTLVSGDDIPQKLIETLLLVEDKEFYNHFGISPSGILRALINNIRAGKTVQGGSTLTQQLVKNMFLTRDKTLIRKANEAIMALLLEYHYSKDQLLEAYINEVYLGQNYANGVYGFGLGAKFYFNRELHELSSEQIATLVGIVKGPSFYDPWRFPERTKERRDLILQLMFQERFISVNEYTRSIDEPLTIRKERRRNKQKYPDYLQLVKQELQEHVDEVNKYSGINVYTGFSLYSQHALINALSLKMPQLQRSNKGSELQAAMVVSDITTGEVKALIGDKVSGYAGFNRALNAKRPIGSLIKPVVYLAALQQHNKFNLATVLEDKEITLGSNNGMQWKPKNYSGEYQGQVPLIDALTKSLNVPTVNLGMKLGLEKVEKAIQLLGYNQSIALRPSLLLGSINMSPYEVSQFYLPIAAHGQLVKGHAIKSIYGDNEGLVWQFTPPSKQIVAQEVSYLVDYALTKVAEEGTAKTLTWRLNKAVVAGKTGTTNDQRDSWFVGYDNKHLVTTWVGNDDNKSTSLTGSSGALVLFAEFMKNQGVENKQFEQPYGISVVHFEQETGNFVSDKCDNTVVLPAVSVGLVASEECLQEKPQGIQAIGDWFNTLFGE